MRLHEGMELGVLLLEVAWMHAARAMVEASEVNHGRAGRQASIGGGHGQRGTKSHTKAQGGSVQVTGLRMIERVRASGRGSIVPWWRVGEVGKGEGTRVHQ